MPRAKPEWQYSTIGGYWHSPLSNQAQQRIRDALAKFDKAAVDRFIDVCGAIASKYPTVREQAEHAPTNNSRKVAARKVAALADELAATLPEMGGNMLDYLDHRITTGRSVVSLHSLGDQLAELAEDMRDVDRYIPDGAGTRPKPKQALAREIAEAFEKTLGARPTVWLDETTGTTSPFILILDTILGEVDRWHSLNAVKNIAVQAVSE